MEITKIWKTTVTEILDERFFIKDTECEFSNNHTKYHDIFVTAATPEEAIIKTHQQIKNLKWHAIYCKEKIAPGKFISHTKHNDPLIDELYEKYN